MTRLHHMLAALFAATLLLAACGGQTATNDAPERTEPPAAAEPTEATEPTAAPVAEDEATEAVTEAASAAGFPVTVTDGLGRELTFEEPPERVVAIYNGNFGNLATLGVRPVATLANESMLAAPRYFEDGESIPSVGATDGGIDLEAVAAADPDLILGFGMEQVQSMGEIAPIYSPLDTDTLEGLYAETRNLGTILGVADRAEEAIRAFQDRFAAYKALAPRDVSVMVAAPDGDNLSSVSLRTEAGPDCQILNEIAICNWDDPTGGESWGYDTTPEALLEMNPDFIYFWDEWDGTKEELPAFLRQDPLWAELDAVQNERVLHVDGYSNPVTSSLVATEQLLDIFAPLLYPDVFPDGPLTDEQVQEIVGGEASSDASVADFPVTITDGAGRELTFEQSPERVVALYNGNFGRMASLGVRPVATLANEEMLSDPIYFEDGESIPSVRAPDGEIDLEAVAAADPDLILAFSLEEAQSMEALAPVYIPQEFDSLDGLYTETRNLARILGIQERAEEIISAFQDRLAAYQELTAGGFSVLMLGVMGDNSVWIHTLDDPMCGILDTMARCPWETPFETEFAGYEGTIEAVLDMNPDVIILNNWTDSSDEAVVQELESNPLWQELDAVQNERILSTPGYDNPISSSLPATQKFLDIYMPLLFPDILDGPLTDEEVQEILAEAQ